MKAVLALALIAAAAAVAPPRIELDLSAMTNAYKLKRNIYRSHDLGYKQPTGRKVLSRQDWTEKCPAGRSTNHVNCPFPSAKAYDHQDKIVSVTTRVKLVDLDGTSMNLRVRQVNFARRSTYLFRYDAHDRAGNRAEQVIFALILDDTVAPKIAMCNGVAETVEAASKWKLCGTSKAYDNIDGRVGLSYSITYMRTNTRLCRKCRYSVAVTKITTLVKGKFLVTLHSNDRAGVYGRNSKNNCASINKAVFVRDTRPPYIDVHGAEPTVHECSRKYRDAHATATDLLDTVALGKFIKVTPSSNVRGAKVGNYKVRYNARDAAGNRARTQTRNVRVRDTTKPSLRLKGKSQVVHYAGRKFFDAGVVCKDTCDFRLRPVRMRWSRPWNDKKLGDYNRYYTCCDVSKNCRTIKRKFTIIDDSQPIITIMGNQIETYEASRDVEYTDKGATCHDYVDGVLSHAVEVSGQVVNMRIPGRYVIRYDCQDLSGNQAEPMNRTVIIQDTICPKITLKGKSQLFVEAGFPYRDAGAIATDTLDGDITRKVWTDGDTVDTGSAFYSRRSCREIKKAYKGAKTGFYYITVYVARARKFTRLPVWCDMTSTTGFTYYAVVCGKRVRPYTKYQQGDCAKYGLRMAIFSSAAAKARAFAKFHDKKAKKHSMYFPAKRSTTDYYLCSTNDAYVRKFNSPNKSKIGIDESPLGSGRRIHHNQISRAEAGKYVIFYHVSDKALNKECKTIKRTVTVKDTLPPVITLHLKKRLIHVSNYKQKGWGGQKNPAGFRGQNPFLSRKYKPSVTIPNRFMAEEAQTSSVNGWVIGAVASAVSGLALLANTLRKTDVAVPV
jgi:hypothetical protein